ncbi:hypothetical protein [Nostoc parmelioides]|uniref:Uncharacterized protein n=1 Tax=Nostoc parmelioides FACHB-3921 TaxID=2692909 RepID=A0ABR8BK86_9NOSO|nr:hypothetical protein [Nostoc parmelioides]MBD2254298.1 hypothetical protein [Nostoc parmelioides FACHB-3921]
MSQQHNSYVELPRIKRKSNSWEGKVIDYLLNHPSNRPATEFAIEAITAFWLAEALEGQVSQPELQKACWSAIERLEAKLATIRRIGRIEKLLPEGATVLSPSEKTVNPTTTNENSNENLNDLHLSTDEDEDEDEDTDGWMDIELSEEKKQMRKLFGIE